MLPEAKTKTGRVTKDLVRFCHQLQYSELPEDVIHKAKYFLLDFIGVAIAGSRSDSSRVIIDFVSEAKGNGTVIATGVGTRFEYAALANGAMAHALEIDDTSTEASLHPGAAIFPAALAASEIAPCDGRQFISSVVAGYDTMIRLGKAVNPSEHYARGFHATGTCGVFGATAAAAKILGLNEKEMTNALGIAGSMTSGSMAFLQPSGEQGAWTKRLHPGWAAHNGIMAARLAAKGFNAPPEIIEGRNGFLPSFSVNPDFDLVTRDLGESFQILEVSIKNHACCRYKQSALDAVLALVMENDLQPGDIKKITLQLVGTAMPIVAEPASVKRDPKSIVDAQFSMHFGAAAAILRRSAFLDEYRMDLILSAEARDLMQKVDCQHNPTLDEVFPAVWPSVAIIETTDGRTLEKRVDYPKGDPNNPLTQEELGDRFELLTKDIYSEDKRRKIKEIATDFENVDSVADCCKYLRA